MAYDRTQQARISSGLCKDCGKPRGDDGTSIRCRQCASEAAKRATIRTDRIRKERGTNGTCPGCGSKRDGQTVYCSPCREKKRAGPKYYQIRRAQNSENGKCRDCGKEKYHQSNYCRFHFIANIAHQYKIPAAMWDNLLQKLEESDFTCFYTGKKIAPGIDACVDHLYSRSQHPDKISDLDNLVWCDKWVNRMKGYMSYQDFIVLCQTIVDHAKVQQ